MAINKKVFFSLIGLHIVFLMLDIALYVNSIEKNDEAIMHKLEFLFTPFLFGYFIILVYLIAKQAWQALILTIITFLVHAIIPSLLKHDGHLLGLLTNIFIVLVLLILWKVI